MPRFLFIFLFLALAINSYGQQVNPDALLQLQQERVQANKEKKERVQRYINSHARVPLRQGVLLVDVTPTGRPIYKGTFNAEAAATTGASRLQNQLIGLNLEGENMVVGIWDDGIVKNHVEFGSRILTKQGLTEALHATHVTGTILASGVKPSAKGMAPKAQATTWDYENDDVEMAALAKVDQSTLLFSNHSYGTLTGWFKLEGVWTWSGEPKISNDEDYRFGFYAEAAQTLDQMAFLAPYYTIMWAAGNDRAEVGDGTHPPDGNGGTGYDCMIPEATAKNLIAVGAVNKVASYTGPSSVALSNFSSTGPTDDGRIKPDLVAAGVAVHSTSATATNSYATLSGTSMATPNATGSLVLIQELYKKLHAGNYMKASTLKALAIHTAKEAGSFPGPDYQFGWGLLDVEAAAKLLLKEDNENTFVQEQTLNNGQVFTIPIQSKANQKITVTICWTDPAGNPVTESLDPTDLMLVNDLDVRITDGASVEKFPWILNPFIPSNKATTGDNFRDNVEKLEFDSPEAKKYFVNVSHKGTLKNGKQNFSIVVTCQSSLSSAMTYYWIGSDGNWNDGAHWSLTSGGAAANTVPTANDYAVFDENSFDNTAGRVVALTSNTAIKKLTWVTNKNAGISLNTQTLKVSGDFAVAGNNFKFTTEGTLQLESSVDRRFAVHTGNISKASLLFNGGKWTVSGDLAVSSLTVDSGEVLWLNADIFLPAFTVEPNAIFDLSGTSITGLTQSSVKSLATLRSATSSLVLQGNANLDWAGVQFDGTVRVPAGKTLLMSGDNAIDELIIASGADLTLADGSELELAMLSVTSDAINEVVIQSPGHAVVNMPVHQKLCFDFMEITNVDLTGKAIVSVGLNSIIGNADNWQEVSCDEALFADFDATFTCAGSLATFTDKSSGNIITWNWTFGDVGSASNSAETKDAFHIFAATGTYAVTLSVTDGISSDSFTEEIVIKANNLSANSIVLNTGTSLMSFHSAPSYQWFKDGEKIAGAVARSYDFGGEPGVYSVVLHNGGSCNVISSYVITGVEHEGKGMNIFPVPANDVINLHKPDSKKAKVVIYNALGQIVTQVDFNKTDITIDVRQFPEGFYHLEIKSSTYTHQQKFTIERD